MKSFVKTQSCISCAKIFFVSQSHVKIQPQQKQSIIKLIPNSEFRNESDHRLTLFGQISTMSPRDGIIVVLFRFVLFFQDTLNLLTVYFCTTVTF
jgi:hypothetical protein